MSKRWKVRKRNAAAQEAWRKNWDESAKKVDEGFRKLIEWIKEDQKKKQDSP